MRALTSCVLFLDKALKGSLVYFIEFCQILAMKLNVCEEITSMGLNDKTVYVSRALKLKITNERD